MLRSDNFIAFLTVVGFFIGIIFALLHDFAPENFLYSVLLISGIFYILGIASSGFFIKYISIKKLFELDKNLLEATMDKQIYELDKKEESIRESHYFIQKIEDEELSYYNQQQEKRDAKK